MANFKLNGVTVATESGGTVSLDSGVTGTQFKSQVAPVAGDIVQFHHQTKPGAVQVTSSSNTNTVSGCAHNLISDVINTGPITSTIWRVWSGCCAASSVVNCAYSCRHWYSIDGGTNWSVFLTSGSAAGHGKYITYDQGNDGYFHIQRTDYMVMAANEDNTKFASAWYSQESDSIRWNHSTGAGPPWLEIMQLKI